MYSQASFEENFWNKNGGFHFKFDRFEEDNEGKHINWLSLVDSPSTFMFFVVPLSTVRHFDAIFNNLNNDDKLHHRFIKHFSEFAGDVVSCSALYNAYLLRENAILQRLLESSDKKVK